MKRLTLVLILICLISSPALAKTLYVNGSTGSDATTYAANDAAHPWATFSRACWGSTNRSAPVSAQAAQAGDTVYIAAGTYYGVGTGTRFGAIYEPINSGSAGNRITFEAVGTVILRHSSGTGPTFGVASTGGAISATPKSYITFKGFTVNEVDAPQSGADSGVAMLHTGSYNTIENCIFNGNAASPLANNHAQIWGQNSDFITIRNCYFQNNLNGGSFHHNAGALMTYYCNDGLFEHNESYNCGVGITLKGGNNERWTIRYNKVHDGGEGITVTGQWEYNNGVGKIYQNLSYNNRDGGIAFSGGDYYSHFRVVNNTLYNNGTGIYFGGNTTPLIDNVIQNNIIYGSSEAIAAGDCQSGYCTSGALLDYNNYYSLAEFSDAFVAYNTIAAWRTHLGGCPGTGNDCSSITTNPLFAETTTYKLQAGSPAVTLGRTITEVHGSSGVTIPAGAYITGNEVIGIDSGGDTVLPTASTKTIASNGTSLTLTFDEVVSIGAGGNGGWTISPSGGAATLTYSSGSGSSSLVYTISRAIQFNETATVSYTQPTNGVEDTAGNDLENIIASSVTNSSTQGQTDTTPPVCTITSPTTNTTWPTSSATLTIQGSAIDAVGVTSISFTCPTCTPSSGVMSCSGCTGQSVTWSQLVAFSSGANTFTATATDGTNTHADAIIITYTPAVADPPPSSVRGINMRGVYRR